MCIAILQKPNSRIKKKVLKTCYYNNNDSMGMLWVENGKLRTHKELLHFESFYKEYDRVCNRVGKISNIVLHFRIATHGLIDLKNCHPHFISKEIAFVHNGIICIETDGWESDTVAFNKTILKGLPQDNFMYCDGIFKLIDGFAFDSKFIFLSKDNKYKIIGDEKGEWNKGIWYSNSSYKHYKTYIINSTTTTSTTSKAIDRVNHFPTDHGYGDGYGKGAYNDYHARYRTNMFKDDEKVFQCLCCNEQYEYLPVSCKVCNGKDFEPIFIGSIKEDIDETELNDGFSIVNGKGFEEKEDIEQEELELLWQTELAELDKADELELARLKKLEPQGKRCKGLERFLLNKVKQVKIKNT